MASEKNDAPAASTSSASDVEIVPGTINEKKLLRTLDLRLLPAVSILYLLSFLDRSNGTNFILPNANEDILTNSPVANARIEGLTTDLGMTGNQYLTGLTLYFIGYVLFEIPCNIVLKRTTPKFWLPTLTVVWGVVATLMGVTQNLSGFFAILAYGIAHMRNEGLLTIIIGIIAYWFISNYPATVSWLSKEERAFVQARLKADSDATNDEAFSWAEVLLAAKDIKIWLYAFAFHTMSLPLYTLSLFLPTIIRDMGYTSAQSQLLTIPPYAVATLFTIFWAILSERYARRALFILTTSTVAIIGYIILLANTDPKARPGVSYVGTFFAAIGIYPSVALVLCWPAINVSGQTKRATANAMQISIGNLGAVLGTQLYRANSGPRYVLGHSFALGYLCLNLLVVGVLWVLLQRENAEKERVLVERPQTGGFHDSVEDVKMGDRHPRWRFQV
ncbi:hypothetical protein J4E85_001080 [Alternaria conjuncta]|uniref:uncharacterized protein n=1 Tax=Alternaria conjuncta TaxID=181017 RepID=UPI00221E5EE7|nr:uncharacterized protein J4E85_001080 [Alternaria conjuncta]KAI4938639.1 hypothetical protein J4E85_001080 [Alternaria conjuncta]